MIEEENSTNTGQGVGGIGPGCKEAKYLPYLNIIIA